MSNQDDLNQLASVLISRYSASVGGARTIDLCRARRITSDIVHRGCRYIVLHVRRFGRVQEHYCTIPALPPASTPEGMEARTNVGKYMDVLTVRYLDEIERMGAEPEDNIIFSALKAQVLREARALALTQDAWNSEILFPFHDGTVNALSFMSPDILFCGVGVNIDRPSLKSLTVTTSKFMVWHLKKDHPA